MPDLNFEVEGAEPLAVRGGAAAGLQAPDHRRGRRRGRCRSRPSPCAARSGSSRPGGAMPRREQERLSTCSASRALGPDAPEPALDAREPRRPAVHGRDGGRPAGAVHLRLQPRRHQVFPCPGGWRPPALPPLQRDDLLRRRRRRAAAGQPDLLGEGGGLPAAGAGLAGDDGPLLSQQRLALPPPGRVRPARPLQEPAGLADLGTGAGTPPRRAAEEPSRRHEPSRSSTGSPTPSSTRATSSTPTGPR